MSNELNELDLDLSDLEVQEDTPSSEGEFERTERMFKKSLEIVQAAMENVIQEILITLEDGSSHVVYVTTLDIQPDGRVSLDFSTLDQEKKAELTPHVENCVKIQIQQAMTEYKFKKRFKLFK